jgi:hypothetical protein
MADKRNDKDWNEYLNEPFKELAKEVAPNEKALSGELDKQIFDDVFGTKNAKRSKSTKRKE